MAIMGSNPYAIFFRSLRELPHLEEHSIVLRSNPSLDQRVYNMPTSDHVAAIWHLQNGTPTDRPHDIRVTLIELIIYSIIMDAMIHYSTPYCSHSGSQDGMPGFKSCQKIVCSLQSAAQETALDKM